jgi:hypothetical protein
MCVDVVSYSREFLLIYRVLYLPFCVNFKERDKQKHFLQPFHSRINVLGCLDTTIVIC